MKDYLKIIIVCTLCLAFLIVVFGLVFGPVLKSDKSAETAVVQPEPASQEPVFEEPAEPAFPDESEYVQIIADNANSSSGLMEFAQRLLSGYILYKDKFGVYTYKPVNRDLPQNDYDWDNLVPAGLGSRELNYMENGVIKSIKGIDVSKYQENIDWEEVAESGVKYAFLRVGYRGYSEGQLQLDPSFEGNAAGALKNDIAVGVYFWTQAATVEEAEEEADFIIEAIKPYNVTWPVALDLEDSPGTDRTAGLSASERTDIIIAFCERIKKAGYTPMLYCNIRWFMDEMELERLTGYDKWFAQYFNRPFFPYELAVWQYTNKASVPGIEGNVDLNMSFKDYGKIE